MTFLQLPNLVYPARVLALLSVFSVCSPVWASDADPDPEEIDKIFAMYDNSDMPGCATAVFRDGRTVFSKGYGIANLDYGIAISDSSRFYMASVSKQFTAAAAGLLMVRGQLDGQARVNEYIEGWPEWADAVEVHHLFNHTSGLPDIYGIMGIAGISISNVMDLEDYLEVIKMGESLMFEPGSEYSYTNSAYTTLAILVETISGKSFPEFVNDEFLEPFGMTSSHFHNDRHRIIPNRVISYRPQGGAYHRSYLGNFQGVGGGGLYSTLQDWERWEAFWHGSLEWNGGITPEEAAELKAMMIIPAAAGGEPVEYGMGLNISVRKGTSVIGHGGSFMGFKTDYRRYPEFGTSMVTLCNRGDADPQDFNHKLADLFLAEKFGAFLAPYEGVYHNSELPVDYRLTAENGTLKLDRRLSPNGLMSEDEPDVWSAGSWEFAFFRDDETGRIEGFRVDAGRARDVEFLKREMASFSNTE